MFTRLEMGLRGIQRAVSRSEWIVRLLGMPRLDSSRADPGLLIVQVDGLGHRQAQRALARGRLPHLARLLARDHYCLHDLHSGLPSATPAFQAELLHGVAGAVPAFGYRDAESGRIVHLVEPAAAARLQRRLDADAPGLAVDGSVHAGILTGGAREAHWCAAAMEPAAVVRALRPLRLAVATVAHLPALLRIAVLALFELALALVDVARGIIRLGELGAELKFVASRVGVTIVLRELTVATAALDLARGLPLVLVDFVGYDEQAHRRGPRSAFAHWSLKGIDAAIHRLHQAARRSGRRHYELWVLSDHGQEEAVPFETLNGQPLPDVVAALLDSARQPSAAAARRERSTHSAWPRPRGSSVGLPAPAADAFQLAHAGPLAHLYVPGVPGSAARRGLATRLVAAGVPLVLVPEAPGRALAVTSAGEHRLPRDAEAIVGEEHPWRDVVAHDLVATCHHPEAGDLILSGWRPDARPVTFALEHGSHGGPGTDETHAFVLAPEGALPPPPPGRPLRPRDLREAALALLRGEAATHAAAARLPRAEVVADELPQPVHLRVMSYNVHGCVGTDGVLSLERIATVIARARPDVVALQELDAGRTRSGGRDQAHAIAALLEMKHHFHPAFHVEEERYGDALLSPLPFRLVRAAALPRFDAASRDEPRGALWIQVETGGRPLQVVTTHLGLTSRERRSHAEALLGPDWLGSPDCADPVVLLGDLNALPGGRTLGRLTRSLRDAQREAPGHRPQPTFASARPVVRLDHVLLRGPVRAVEVRVPRGPLARVASDHLPLVVDLVLAPVRRNPAEARTEEIAVAGRERG
jgi:endonuclease/exonuclease/phosphatase family metal-dependent hydrolase